MTPRISYVVSAAPGFVPDGTPTARDVLDLLDVDLWANYGPPDPYDWAGPMFVALFVLIGAFPQEATDALATDVRSEDDDGGEPKLDEITLHNGYGGRNVPVIDLARSILLRGAKEMAKVRKCDRLIVNREGGPFTPQLIEHLFARLSRKIGIGSFGLPLRLRNAYRGWIEECEKPHAIAHLCRLRAKIEAGRRRRTPDPTMSSLRAIVEEFHPLGKMTRPLLHHVGAVDRALPDRAFPTLSAEAVADVQAVRDGPRGAFCYPPELVRAVLAAWDGGRRAAEIAAHYDIPDQFVSLWNRRRAKGEDPTVPTRPLRVRSIREGTLTHIRRHPDKTVFDIQDWVAKRFGTKIEIYVLRDFGVAHGHRFASAQKRALAKKDRIALARFLRDHPRARMRDAKAFIKDRTGGSPKTNMLFDFAKSIDFVFTRRPGPSSEPTRSLLLAYIPAHPEATAEDVAEWLALEPRIEVNLRTLRGFAKAQGLTFARKRPCRNNGRTASAPEDKQRERPSAEREPYRSAILAHVAANPHKMARHIREWIKEEFKFKISKSALNRFAKRHGLKFGLAATAVFAQEADEALLAHLRDNPGTTRPEAREWISRRLGRSVCNNMMGSFARRHGHRFPQTRTKIDFEPVRTWVIGYLRAHPGCTASEAAMWIEKSLRISVSAGCARSFAEKHGFVLRLEIPLKNKANCRKVLSFFAAHGTATVRDAQAWYRRNFKQDISLPRLRTFARKNGHRFAPSWVGPDAEPYRSKLLQWIRRNPGATAPQARKWMFETFAVDVRSDRLHGFATRNGLKLANGNEAPLPRGVAKKLMRDAALVGLRNPSRGFRASTPP